MPHTSFFSSTNIDPISNSTGWSTWKFPWKRLKHQKLDTYHWKGSFVLFDRTNKIHSFFHLTLTSNKVSSLHYLQRNALCPADFAHLKRPLDVKVTCTTLYHSSLQKIFVYLNRSFHVSLHYLELWTLNEYFKLSMTQSPGEGFDARQSFTAVPPELNFLIELRHLRFIEEYRRENSESVTQYAIMVCFAYIFSWSCQVWLLAPLFFLNVSTSSDKRRKLKRKVISTRV